MRTLLTVLLRLLLPSTGRHRRTINATYCAKGERPGNYGFAHRSPRREPATPPPTVPRRRLIRTTRAVLTVVNGDASPLVRPYLALHEAQEQRRRALDLALDGIDVGPEIIHGIRVPA